MDHAACVAAERTPPRTSVRCDDMEYFHSAPSFEALEEIEQVVDRYAAVGCAGAAAVVHVGTDETA